MGEVWRAHDTITNRVVAVKVLPAHLVDDKVFQQRFRREAQAAASLNEPHVVPIHDFGEIDGRLFVNMRLIEGQDLQALLDGGALEPARAVGIIEQIAAALHAAHEVDLVHRDVKPSNILVSKGDFSYLIDFGIARAAGETGLTSTGAAVGTWAYMAPERFRAGEAHARADVYALACVLYQCLTGQVPFPGDTLEQIALAHIVEPPPQPSALRHGIPTAMDHVIVTGMAKNPTSATKPPPSWPPPPTTPSSRYPPQPAIRTPPPPRLPTRPGPHPPALPKRCHPRPHQNRRGNSQPNPPSPRPNNAHPAGRPPHNPDPPTVRPLGPLHRNRSRGPTTCSGR